MKNFFIAIVITILTSLYYFPFDPVWMPSVNTKMALAVLSLPLLLIKAARNPGGRLDRGLFVVSIFGMLVTFAGLVSVVVNNTGDYTYASYFLSMWVWIGGAYVVVYAIKVAYGNVNIRLLGNFLIATCICQCILSQLINSNEYVANFANSIMASTGYMGRHESRLYGIGCALDVAGLKFCAVLIITAYFAITPMSKKNPRYEQFIYLCAFFFISIYGSMIARTTSIGMMLSFIMWIFCYFRGDDGEDNDNKRVKRTDVLSMLRILAFLLVVLIPIIVLLYNIKPVFKANLRFAFEGFFSLAEKGVWDVHSNKQLGSMVVWPDNLKTWLIGDGYFELPQLDFYYTGPLYNYYMGTDVGYCRLVFYFGIFGLLFFSAVFIASAIICSKKYPKYTIMFWTIAIMNFLGWIKVSSDIFVAFAVFLCLTMLDEGDTETELEQNVKIDSNENNLLPL